MKKKGYLKGIPPAKSNQYPDFDRLSSIIDSADAAIWSVDRNFQLVFSNQKYKKWITEIFGEEVLTYEHILEKIPEEEKRMWKQLYNRALSGETFSIEQKSNLREDNRWNIYHISPVKEHDNSISGVTVVAHNVTNKRIEKNKLLETNDRFEEFVKMLPEAIFEIDENFNLTYANQKAFDLFGYSDTDFVEGYNALDMLAPENREVAMKNFKSRSEGQNPGTVEYIAQKKDGTKFPILFHANSIIKKGKVIGARGVIIDITERKRISEQQKQMALMLDLAPSSIVIHDFEGKILYANEKTFELHKYTKEEFYKQTLSQLDISHSLAEINNRIDLIKNGKQVSFKVKHFRKDGSILPLEMFAVGTRWNNIEAVLSVGTDISEHLKHEHEIKVSEEKFKTITESSPDAIFLVDNEGKYVYANKSASEMLGYTVDELLKLNVKDLGKSNTSGLRLSDVLSQGKLYTEMQLIRKNGEVVNVDLNAVVLPNGLIYGSCRDLTERQEFENKLKKSYTMLNKLTDSVPGVVFQYRLYPDGSHTFPYASSGIRGIYDTTPEEVFSNPDILFSRLHPEDYENILNAIKESSENLTLFHIEFRVVLPKQGVQWRLCEAKPERLKDGSTLWSGIITDIGERKKVEKQLRANETFLNETQEIADLGTYNLNIISGTWECSEIMNDIFGIDYTFEKDIEGWLSIVHPAWREKMKDYLLNEVIEQKKGFDTEYKIVRFNDKAERWVHGLGRLEFDKSGQAIKMIGSIQDITEAKVIQEELTKAKERAEEVERQLLAILENSPTGFAINSISSGKIRYINKAFMDIYHIPSELCKNVETFIDYVYADKKELGQKIVEDIMTGDQDRMKWEMIPVTDKSTNKTHYVSAANIILGDLDLMISSVWDVTTQVENEEKLITALNKAQESDRLKSAFLANMSHEIRTPMNGIMGFANLLKEPQLSGEEQKKYIEIIEKSGIRMLNTINDIIDISKIEAGQMEVSISEVDVTELLDNILLFFTPEAKAKGLNLICSNYPEDDSKLIESDYEKINAILTNLVKNAIKYCDHGKIDFGCVKKSDFIEFYVNDTGRGIAQERQNAIFERFVQADIDDKEVKEGSGLGLAISKSYVKLLGGQIWVKSKKNVGSTFYFTIPYSQISTKTNQNILQTLPIEEEMKKLNILIAEDDKTSELLIKLMLNNYSNKVLSASTGTEALEMCKSNPDIDLILMDIKMPMMDGYEATKKIREFNNDVVIIAVTAFALSGDREKAINAGCNDYLSKPVSKEKLNELLKLYFKQPAY